MNPILVALPYHQGDYDLAVKLVAWMCELGSCRPNSLLLCADSAVPQEKMRDLMGMARPNFVRVTTMIVTVPAATAERKVWPPNVMFLNAARQVQACHTFNFLWMA